jgi:hypothetical protein
MRHLILFVFLFITTQFINAQTDSCKVLLDKIIGKYTGECLNGLADGKGKSIGEDTYIGTFKDGLPDGKGKYIFKNGDVFTGDWLKGQKNGKGKFEVSINGKKNTINGYWKEDEYVGVSEPGVPYRVTNSSGLLDYKVEKNKPVNDFENDNQITFSIKSAFTDFLPSDLKIDKSSGQITQIGKKFVVTQYLCPIHCEISYSIKVGGSRKQCRFIIDVLEKGKFTVNLSND